MIHSNAALDMQTGSCYLKEVHVIVTALRAEMPSL